MPKLLIEGESLREILEWPEAYFDSLVLTDEPIVFHIGSAEVLGQFAIKDNELLVELAQIDGGGEGVLPAISKIALYLGRLKSVQNINCIVHAIDCAKPNLKRQAHLEKTGFKITEVSGKGRAYFKQIPLT